MKKIFILGIAFLAVIGNTDAQKTWDGGGADNNFSTANNWNDNLAPIGGNGENYIFDATSTKTCIVDVSLDAASFSVMTGYTGTIDMNNGSHSIGGNFVINSGTVIGTSNDLTMTSFASGTRFEVGSSATYSPTSTGTIIIQYPGSNVTFSFVGTAITLNHLRLECPNTGGTKTIDFGTGVAVNNISFSSAGSTRIFAYAGTPRIKVGLNMSGAIYTSSTAAAASTATFVFDGSNAFITGNSIAGTGYLPSIQMNTSGTYSISNNLNITGNWTGTQGTLTVGSSTENFYGASAAISGTAAAFDNLNIQSGASVSMPSNAQVKLGGTLTTGGTLNFQTTTALGLNGSGAQTISSLGGKTLAAINSYSTGSSRAVTLSGAITILDSIKVESTVTLNTGGSITLKSSSSLTARVAESNGTISGNVIAETFLKGGLTGWANLGVRGITGQTFASWDTYASSSAANGIPMTCQGCFYGVTALGSYFESIQGWDEANDTYDTLLTSSTALTPGKGFWVYVGDATTNTNGLKLINTGAVVQGAQSANLTSNGLGDNPPTSSVWYNLVANPYPSPISWNRLATVGLNSFNVTSNVYVFNADIGATVSYNGVTSSHSPPVGIDDVIAGGQGFYVEYNGPTAFGTTLDFSEATKVSNNTSANPVLKPAASAVSLFRLKLEGANDWDETAFMFHAAATNTYGKYDANKIFKTPGYLGYPGSYSKYTTISSKDLQDGDKDYSINALAPLANNLNIPVLVKVSTTGSYTISAKDFQNFATCVGLIDKLNNSYHDLRLNPYVCTINDTTSSPRFELVLCRDESINPTGISEVSNSNSVFINQDQQGAFVKTAFAQNTRATISVYNIMGQKLMSDINVEGMVTTTRLNLDQHNQVVLIRVVSDKEISTKKIIIH